MEGKRPKYTKYRDEFIMRSEIEGVEVRVVSGKNMSKCTVNGDRF